MDFRPPQWGSARAHRTARTVGASPGGLKSINLIPHCHFARLPRIAYTVGAPQSANSRTGKIVRHHALVRMRFVDPPLVVFL